MDSGPEHMPAKVLTAAIPVLVYSFICLSFGFLLITVVCRTSNGFSYVLLFAIATTCTTVISITQQCNYIANWHELRIQQYEQSVTAKGHPSLALGPLSRGFNAVLFWIILYTYNVDSVTIAFWAVALVFKVWNWKSKLIQRHGTCFGIVSKTLAVVLPAILLALRRFYEVNAGYIGTLILMNILMLVSFTVGAVCIILILTRYLRTRLRFGSYATGSKSYQSGTVATAASRNMSGIHVDPWLIVRFTIAFLILSGFEAFLIKFEINRYHKIVRNNLMKAPDFSIGPSIIDVLNYIPGVTASLLAFLLFGTTAQHRTMYSSLINFLNPFTRKKRPSSKRLSGPAEEWRRMGSQDYLSSGPALHNIEMNPQQLNETPKPQMFVTEEDPPLPKRASIRKIFASPWPLKEIGVLEDCESTISSPTKTVH